jgi:hypothetical protein
VPVLTVRQVELLQHVTDVGLDRPLAQLDALGDAGVGQALRHQAEQLVLLSRGVWTRTVWLLPHAMFWTWVATVSIVLIRRPPGRPGGPVET